MIAATSKKILIAIGVWAAFSVPRAWAPPPARPLSEIFQDMEKANRDQVLAEAARQATTQPRYKSCQVETKPFEGCLVPNQDGIEVAVFSDDGVDVEVDGVLVVNNFKKPQHLPNLKKSFHVLNGPDAKGGKWLGGKVYHVKVNYSNILFTGNADIDGCTLFAYEGGGAVVKPKIDFERVADGKIVEFVPLFRPQPVIRLPKIEEKDLMGDQHVLHPHEFQVFDSITYVNSLEFSKNGSRKNRE